jgi:hypothetical protein
MFLPNGKDVNHFFLLRCGVARDDPRYLVLTYLKVVMPDEMTEMNSTEFQAGKVRCGIVGKPIQSFLGLN